MVGQAELLRREQIINGCDDFPSIFVITSRQILDMVVANVLRSFELALLAHSAQVRKEHSTALFRL